MAGGLCRAPGAGAGVYKKFSQAKCLNPGSMELCRMVRKKLDQARLSVDRVISPHGNRSAVSGFLSDVSKGRLPCPGASIPPDGHRWRQRSWNVDLPGPLAELLYWYWPRALGRLLLERGGAAVLLFQLTDCLGLRTINACFFRDVTIASPMPK